jgi:hypothetical protein
MGQDRSHRNPSLRRDAEYMPLVDVTYDNSVSEAALVRLGQVLPDIVAEAVACTEEPRTGPPAPGDIEIRFRSKGSFEWENSPAWWR